MSKRRGAPTKKDDDGLGKTIQFRSKDDENAAFEQAARLSGLSKSGWMRERLRAAARTELEGAGRSVPFLSTEKS